MPSSESRVFYGSDAPGGGRAGDIWINERGVLQVFNGTAWMTNRSLTGTVTAASGAATLNQPSGRVTSEALTTAAGADYTLTLTNSYVAAASRVLASLQNGTNTIAPIYVRLVTPAAGSVVIIVRNAHASSALDGTIIVNFYVDV